ncbi:MAG: ABC transporter substrate-binding protein [Egibacteraceae bacterium]
MNGAGRVIRTLASTALAVVALVGGAGAPSGAAAQEAITITDVKGRTVTVDAPVKRVVCLVSLCEDMLLELGMRPLARTGELLEHPAFLGEKASEVPQVPGGFLDPDVEAIIGYEPDLVIGLGPGQHDGLAPALEGVAPLWIVNPDSIEESLQYLRDMGTLTGLQKRAAEAERRFRDRLAEAEQGASKDLTALVLIGLDGTFEVIASTYLGDLMGRLFDYPWEVREGPLGGSLYSLEEIAAVDADIIFVLTYNNADPNGPPLSEVLASNPLWSQLTAVKNGDVHEVNTSLWGNGRGTRSLGEVATEALDLANAAG